MAGNCPLKSESTCKPVTWLPLILHSIRRPITGPSICITGTRRTGFYVRWKADVPMILRIGRLLPPQGLAEPPAHLKPDRGGHLRNPIEEPWSPRNSGDSQSIEDSTSALLTIWAKNRSLYPGWIAAPLEARGPLISRTRAWQPNILQIVNSLSIIERLDAIRELVWRHEITLEPISSELESAAQDAISAISDTQTKNGKVESHNVPSQIREASREIALTLVAVARHRLDEGHVHSADRDGHAVS